MSRCSRPRQGWGRMQSVCGGGSRHPLLCNICRRCRTVKTIINVIFFFWCCVSNIECVQCLFLIFGLSIPQPDKNYLNSYLCLTSSLTPPVRPSQILWSVRSMVIGGKATFTTTFSMVGYMLIWRQDRFLKVFLFGVGHHVNLHLGGGTENLAAHRTIVALAASRRRFIYLKTEHWLTSYCCCKITIKTKRKALYVDD